MELLQYFDIEIMAQVFANVLGVMGVLVILFGAIEGFLMYVLQVFSKKNYLNFIRLEVGQHLVLGIEFFVGKDIVETIIDPSFAELGKLGGLVLLRVILTMTLMRELYQVEKQLLDDEKVQTAHAHALKEEFAKSHVDIR